MMQKTSEIVCNIEGRINNLHVLSDLKANTTHVCCCKEIMLRVLLFVNGNDKRNTRVSEDGAKRTAERILNVGTKEKFTRAI